MDSTTNMKELIYVINALIEKKMNKEKLTLHKEIKVLKEQIILLKKKHRLLENNISYPLTSQQHPNNTQQIPTKSLLKGNSNVSTNAIKNLSDIKFSDNPTLNEILKTTANNMSVDEIHDDEIDPIATKNEEGTAGISLNMFSQFIPSLKDKENNKHILKLLDEAAQPTRERVKLEKG